MLQNVIDWNDVSQYQQLSESFIEEFENRVHWNLICQYQKLSEAFMRNNVNNIIWAVVSEYQTKNTYYKVNPQQSSIIEFFMHHIMRRQNSSFPIRFTSIKPLCEHTKISKIIHQRTITKRLSHKHITYKTHYLPFQESER